MSCLSLFWIMSWFSLWSKDAFWGKFLSRLTTCFMILESFLSPHTPLSQAALVKGINFWSCGVYQIFEIDFQDVSLLKESRNIERNCHMNEFEIWSHLADFIKNYILFWKVDFMLSWYWFVLFIKESLRLRYLSLNFIDNQNE
jgi:hypothetical protein